MALTDNPMSLVITGDTKISANVRFDGIIYDINNKVSLSQNSCISVKASGNTLHYTLSDGQITYSGTKSLNVGQTYKICGEIDPPITSSSGKIEYACLLDGTRLYRIISNKIDSSGCSLVFYFS